VIDIVRDYTAIGLGSAQATTNRALGVVHTSTHWVRTWGRPEQAGDPPEANWGPFASIAGAPWSLAGHVQGEMDRLVERFDLVSKAEVRALRQQVQRLERHIGDLRGDR
jgi:polyhydroxyalkanoate synthesis regulator phasin